MLAKSTKQLLLHAFLIGALVFPATATAVTVGKPAPDFKLPSTTGQEISLGQFRGKKMVLIQFYAINFGTT